MCFTKCKKQCQLHNTECKIANHNNLDLIKMKTTPAVQQLTLSDGCTHIHLTEKCKTYHVFHSHTYHLVLNFPQKTNEMSKQNISFKINLFMNLIFVCLYIVSIDCSLTSRRNNQCFLLTKLVDFFLNIASVATANELKYTQLVQECTMLLPKEHNLRWLPNLN